MTVTWTALAGDTSSFAMELSFVADPETHHYDADERESWGSMTLWVNGINVTEHLEQGESLRAAHWYLLPTIEWFVANWDALFHEERLPLSNAASDAAAAMTRLLVQPLRLVRSDLDEFERLEAWQAWWARHNIVESVDGGIFPDLYIRRWGDLSEISVGTTVPPGTPVHFRYQNVGVVGRMPATFVATSIHDVIHRAIAELARRCPGSARLATLRQACDDLMDKKGTRYNKRLAFLSGVDAESDRSLDEFVALWRRVDEALDSELDETAREIAVGHARGGLVLETAPQVALLFGSYCPMVDDDDVQVLLRNLHNVLRERRPTEFPAVKRPALPLLSPGQEGSQLGDAAYAELVDPQADHVDVKAILSQFGITYSMDSLSDRSTRAVSLVTQQYGMHIVVNRNYLRGTSEPVLRFTLAHELGHILFDRKRSLQMSIVSGPWAPLAIEQRANAFAAAFLIPEELLARLSRHLAKPLWHKEAAAQIAGRIQVSLSSLADRMYNLMLITREEADNIKHQPR